jgi:hypothetical protein
MVPLWIKRRQAMKRNSVLGVILAGVLLLSTAGVTSAAGKTSVDGNGTRGTVTFSFSAVIKAGTASGTFDATNPGVWTYQGSVTCGHVVTLPDARAGAVFGGTSTDSSGVTTNVTFEVSDSPDGLIIGSGSTSPCDTTGFGDPTSLPITSGDIQIKGPH